MRGTSRLALFVCLGFGAVAVAKEPPAPGEDKIVCKRQYDADTGSHFAFPKKVCLRKSEWREVEEAADHSLRRLRQQGGACPKCLVTGSGGGPQ